MTDEEFLSRQIGNAKLPATRRVRSQLAWILKAAKSKELVQRPPHVPGGSRNLLKEVTILRNALQSVERTRAKLVRWSEDTSEEAAFCRLSLLMALEGSVIIPETRVDGKDRAHYARRIEEHLPPIHNGLIGELLKIEKYLNKRHSRVRYDPLERTLVQLLWLVFETSGRRVFLSKHGIDTPSQFQSVCIAIFDRATFFSQRGTEPKTNTPGRRNFPNRIFNILQRTSRDKRLDEIKAAVADMRAEAAGVEDTMNAWVEWLLGAPIPKMASNDQK